MSSVNIAARWVDAANRQDIEELIRLSSPDIEVVGPRGSAVGTDILRQWLIRSGITMKNLRAFADCDHVVFEQQAAWNSAATVSTAIVGNHFTIVSAVVSRVARFDSLEAALSDATLSFQHEIPQQKEE